MKLCGFEVGIERPLFLIAGPCVVESEALALDTAGQLKEITQGLGIPFIYKSSYDKANRSSAKSYRGLGMEQGLAILAKVHREIGVPVLTDVHEIEDVAAVAAAVDVLQTPALLCRQTDFIQAVVAAGISGLFMETHPNPDKALSDGPNAWPLGRMKHLLQTLKELDRCVKQQGFAEQSLATD